MGLKWLDEIEAQLDSSAPYYVPRLIATIRAYDQTLNELREGIEEVSKLLDDYSKKNEEEKRARLSRQQEG